ncbi:DUF397 domain-containing protein [Nocardiopsis alkaliphila]|uniref:DUF397 domain-containing protein n=1 Tax=Nocardiopsis alkaliphila TaxID=225762 RepID=UPI000A02FF72|nr:DUF397 domain-containing protein [Nocardiopsis alkaliphila]
MLDMSQNLVFRKSSYSSGRQENCVEVSGVPTGAAVRDTQNRGSGHLAFGVTEWSALLATTRPTRA